MNRDNTPLKNPLEICPKCESWKKYNQGNMSLGDFRLNCQYCKSFGKNGIYKGDLVIAVNSKVISRPVLTPGRKATHYKRYGHAVNELHNQGKSIRAIAETLGISTGTVQKILKQS